MAMEFNEAMREIRRDGNPLRDLSMRARKAIARNRIATIDDVCQLGREGLEYTKNCGVTTIGEIERVLSDNGRKFCDGIVTPPIIIPAINFTLRDYFAAAALQGMVAGRFQPPFVAGMEVHDVVAACAYLYSDAMLTARNPT